MRWLVTLATRYQAPAADGAGIEETVAERVVVYADIQAVGAITLWDAQQTDTPITHRIFMRWHDYLDQTKVVLRSSTRPGGKVRTEVFRVRRIKELGGRKRFVLIEAEMESFG